MDSDAVLDAILWIVNFPIPVDGQLVFITTLVSPS